MTWLETKIEQFICAIRDNPKYEKIPVGPLNNPTYWRWFVLPRNRFFNIYLHNFLHDDEEHLHDHRAMNVSFILQGAYKEERFLWQPEEGRSLPPTDIVDRPNHSIIIRLPSWPHRVILNRDENGKPIPSWSLFIKFPDVRQWGFWCPGFVSWAETGSMTISRARWRHWSKYVNGTNPTAIGYGQRGKGCDE
jgi:hypothetical protein